MIYLIQCFDINEIAQITLMTNLFGGMVFFIKMITHVVTPIFLVSSKSTTSLLLNVPAFTAASTLAGIAYRGVSG